MTFARFSKQNLTISIFTLFIVVSGCRLLPKSTPLHQQTPTPNPYFIPLHEVYQDRPNRNFVLYVSNQSFESTPVDIEILLDGQVIVRRNFKVGNQHEYYTYGFNLSEGSHTIKAKSVTGEVSFEQEFMINKKKWAVLEYWYSTGGGSDTVPRRFTWAMLDQPFAIR